MWDQKHIIGKMNLLTLLSKGQPPNAAQLEFVFSRIRLPRETSGVPWFRRITPRTAFPFPESFPLSGNALAS